MKKLKSLLPLLALLLCSVHFELNYIYLQWFIGCSLLTLLIPGGTTTFKVFVSYLIFSSVNVMFNLYSPIYKTTHMDQINYGFAAAHTGFLVLLFVLSMNTIKKEWLTKLIDALPAFGVINSIYVIITWLFNWRLNGSMGPQGFIDYSGLNSTLISYSIVAITCSKVNKKWLVPCVIAIILSRSSIGFGVIATGISAYLLASGYFKKEVFLKLCLIFVAIVSIGFLSEGVELFDSGGRLSAYSVFLSHWQANYNTILGAGPGSFRILSYGISKLYNFMPIPGQNDVWYWERLHSEYLQVLFEYGWVGLILLLAALSELSYRLFKAKEPRLFALLMAVASSAIFNFPLRYFPSAIVCALIVTASYSALSDE